jgi:gluconokinase|tara:strand:- start:89638 stop:89832 length:195 start_codon:yes stop_codon:yes gene_type:complete
VVLAVSSSGKSLIGKNIADKLGYRFFDGDDFHSTSNVEKMSQGIPLTDDDSEGWLAKISMLKMT